jgi:hypothetical protein
VQGEDDHADVLHCAACVPPVQQLGNLGVQVRLLDVSSWSDLERSYDRTTRDQVHVVSCRMTVTRQRSRGPLDCVFSILLSKC